MVCANEAPKTATQSGEKASGGRALGNARSGEKFSEGDRRSQGVLRTFGIDGVPPSSRARRRRGRTAPSCPGLSFSQEVPVLDVNSGWSMVVRIRRHWWRESDAANQCSKINEYLDMLNTPNDQTPLTYSTFSACADPCYGRYGTEKCKRCNLEELPWQHWKYSRKQLSFSDHVCTTFFPYPHFMHLSSWYVDPSARAEGFLLCRIILWVGYRERSREDKVSSKPWVTMWFIIGVPVERVYRNMIMNGQCVSLVRDRKAKEWKARALLTDCLSRCTHARSPKILLSALHCAGPVRT